MNRTGAKANTATGKKQLVSDQSRWQQMIAAIAAIMSGELERGEP
jgi:hypothetical protein